MKIKITLIVSKTQKGVSFNHPQFFQIYLTDDNQFLCTRMATKDVRQTLSDLFSRHFHLDFDWMVTELAGFRKIADGEAEVTYVSYMSEVLGSNKSGNFFSSQDIKSGNIEIDSYYEKLLSERSRSY
tara:strand:+ start:4094 stop:4474 length:381 start_codon:yes stop_codon:yes gene_type:complete